MQAAAVVTNVSGQAFVVREGKEVALKQGDELFTTDGVRTGLDGKAEFRFTDGSEVMLGGMSAVELRDFAYDPGAPAADQSFALHMMEGLVRTVSGEVVKLNPEGFSLSTPLGTAGIRGTTIVAHIFPSHVVFMVTDMDAGHRVILNSFFGESLTILQAGKGGIISQSDLSRIIPLDAMPEETRDLILKLLQDAAERSSHEDVYLLYGDAALLAALGAAPLGRGLGALSGEQSDLIFKMLEEYGVSGVESFLRNSFGDSDWPTLTWVGTDGDDIWAGARNQHHHASALKGNDSVAVFNGNDTVFGGNGSSDLIVKISPTMGAGSFLYGGEESLSGVTLDPDLIILRDKGNTVDSLDDPNGYFSMQESDYGISVMAGGAIYGSAQTLENCTSAPGGNSISVFGNMSGGAIYGNAQSVSGGSFSGNSIRIAPALDENGNTVGGVFSGGVIYGDGQTLNGAAAGNDRFEIAEMSGGTIYGDAQSMHTSTAGDDSFYIDLFSGGTIYGDAEDLGSDMLSLGVNVYAIGTATGGTIVSSGSRDSVSVVNLEGTLSVNGIIGEVSVDNWGAGGSLAVGSLVGDILASNGAGSMHIEAILGNSSINAGSNASTISIGALLAGSTLDLTNSTNKTVIIDENLIGSAINGGSNAVSITLFSDAMSYSGSSLSIGSSSHDVTMNDATSVSLNVETFNAVATVTTGAGNDRITIGESMGGVIDAGAGTNNIGIDSLNGDMSFIGTGTDIIVIGTHLGGDIAYSGANLTITDARGEGQLYSMLTPPSQNEVSITNLNGGKLAPGSGAIAYTVGTATSGSLSGAGESDNFLVTGAMNGGTLSGFGGVDIFSIQTLTNGTVYGYAEKMTSNTDLQGDDDISILGNMSGGTIYGDFEEVGNSTAPGDFQLCRDNITVMGAMSGGAIYGDFYEVTDSNQFSPLYGNNTITIDSLSDSAAVHGNAQSISGPVSYTGNQNLTGSDSISVTQRMSGGAIFGDAVSMSGLKLAKNLTSGAQFSDSISVGDGMSGGAIYGDARTIDTVDISSAGSDLTMNSGVMNDVISVSGGMSSGTIYGDADSIGSITTAVTTSGNAVYVSDFMADAITVAGGVDSLGVIYGDARTIGSISLQGHAVDLSSSLYFSGFMNDSITIAGGSGLHFSGTLYGDAGSIGSISAGVASSGLDSVGLDFSYMMSDNIILGQPLNSINVSGATIYGDAATLGNLSFSNASVNGLMADTIEIYGDVVNSTIYGDARQADSIGISSEPGYDVSVQDFMSDHITVHGALGQDGVIYGDAPQISGWNVDFYNGSDTFIYNGTTDSGTASFHTLAGGDEISVGILNGGKIYAGFGNDTVTVDLVKGTGNVVDLGSGTDTTNPSFSVATEHDQLKIGKVEDGSVLDVYFGAGTDSLSLNSYTSGSSSSTITVYNYMYSEDDGFQFNIDSAGAFNELSYSAIVTNGDTHITFDGYNDDAFTMTFILKNYIDTGNINITWLAEPVIA